jgi:hypothetical protein
MERRPKEKDSEDGTNLSLVESIRLRAARNARSPLDTEEQLLLFLQSWWSRTYNRPLKDPILLSYTLEELLYEFYDKSERIKAQEEQANQENDKIEESKEKEALDWAEKMEREEMEAEMRKEAESQQAENPALHPENVAWMEEQLEKGRELYGESFGQDIDETFE